MSNPHPDPDDAETDPADDAGTDDQTDEANADPTADADEERASTGTAGGKGRPAPSGDPDDDSGRPKPRVTDDTGLRDYLQYGVIALLSLFALVAAVRFYLSASDVIATWVAAEYRSLFQAVFNLVVLLLAGGGIALQVRRLGN